MQFFCYALNQIFNLLEASGDVTNLQSMLV